MSFMLRSLSKQLVTLSKVMQMQPPLQSTLRHQMNNAAAPRMNFRTIQQTLRNNPDKNYDDLKKKLDDTNVSKDEKFSNLHDFIFLAKNEEDIKIAFDKITKLEDIAERHKKNLGSNLLRRAAQLKNTSVLADSLNNDIFKTSIGISTLCKLHLRNENYAQVLKCFKEYLPEVSKSDYKKVEQRIPVLLLQTVTAALLSMNTPESLQQMKETLKLAATLNSTFSITSTLHFILLCLLQNDVTLASELLHNSGMSRSNFHLHANINSVILAKQDNPAEAIKTLDFVTNPTPTPFNMDEMQLQVKGRTFKFVLNAIKESVLKKDDKELLSKFNDLETKVITRNKLIGLDLVQYSINAPFVAIAPNLIQTPNGLALRPRNFNQQNEENTPQQQQRQFNDNNMGGRFNNNYMRQQQQQQQPGEYQDQPPRRFQQQQQQPQQQQPNTFNNNFFQNRNQNQRTAFNNNRRDLNNNNNNNNNRNITDEL